MNSTIGCVVIPTYVKFLDVLVKRTGEFTTLIWPGHGGKANRMVSPHDWLTDGLRSPGQSKQPPQKAIPFLYRSVGNEEVEPPYEISHVSLAIYMVHDHIYTNNSAIQKALKTIRVERFCDSEWGDEHVRTWYVVSDTFRLDAPIPYNRLWLVKQGRFLDSNFTRGYGLVRLPEHLQNWYNDCIRKRADTLAVLNSERYKYIH